MQDGVLYRSAGFSAAFDRVSHSGLFFRLKSLGVGGTVLPICTELLTDRRLMVVDGAESERIPIISCVPQDPSENYPTCR